MQVASGASGEVENRYDYDAFGEEILAVEETPNDIRYSGEFYDAAAGLYYLRARYYDPATGRFTQEDTYRGDVMEPASLNLYAYCANDPVNYVDPSGNSAVAVGGAILTGTVEAAYVVVQVIAVGAVFIGGTMLLAEAIDYINSIRATPASVSYSDTTNTITAIYDGPIGPPAPPAQKTATAPKTKASSGKTVTKSVSVPKSRPFNYNFPLNDDGTYTIQPDQCLSIIAAAFGIALQDLIDWNVDAYPSLADNPGMIYPGWTLTLENPEWKIARDIAEQYDTEIETAWDAGYAAPTVGIRKLLDAGVADLPYTGPWSLDDWKEQVKEKIDAVPIPTTLTKEKTKEDDGETLIYRWTDIYSPQSLTPVPAGKAGWKAIRNNKGEIIGKTLLRGRKEDDTTLSFSVNPPTNGGGAWMTTLERINETGILQAVLDGDTHVSITPTEAAIALGLGTMADWVASYEVANENPHFYTMLLMLLSVPMGDSSLNPNLAGFTLDSLIFNSNGNVIGYNPYGSGYVDNSNTAANLEITATTPFTPIVSKVYNKYGEVIGYNANGPGYTDYSDAAASIHGGSNMAATQYDNRVWNKYGEIIGYNPYGAGYVDYSNKAADIHGGDSAASNPYVAYVYNRYGELIGYNPNGPGYTDYSNAASKTHGGSEYRDKAWLPQ